MLIRACRCLGPTLSTPPPQHSLTAPAHSDNFKQGGKSNLLLSLFFANKSVGLGKRAEEDAVSTPTSTANWAAGNRLGCTALITALRLLWASVSHFQFCSPAALELSTIIHCTGMLTRITDHNWILTPAREVIFPGSPFSILNAWVRFGAGTSALLDR